MNCENFVKFVKNFLVFDYMKEHHPEKTLSTYGGGDTFRDDKASTFRQQTFSSIKQARVFEIDDGIKKLLSLTDTPIQDEDIHLPFPVIFLDVSFTRDELESYGLEVKSKEVAGILIREGQMVSEEYDSPVGRDLNITMFSRNEKDEYWFDCFNKNIIITNKDVENWNVTIEENPTTCKITRDFIHKFIINFLNFLNNPEVECIEHKRSEKNIERKRKEGKVPIPSSFKIRLSGKIYEYIDELNRGAKWHFNYRFWVRGHFRKLSSERYAEKKTIWVFPYIKGKGVLVDKSYELKGGQDGNKK